MPCGTAVPAPCVGETVDMGHVDRETGVGATQNADHALLLPTYLQHKSPGGEANGNLTRPMPALDGPQRE